MPKKSLLFSISCAECYVQNRRQKRTCVGAHLRQPSTKTKEAVPTNSCLRNRPFSFYSAESTRLPYESSAAAPRRSFFRESPTC